LAPIPIANPPEPPLAADPVPVPLTIPPPPPPLALPAFAGVDAGSMIAIVPVSITAAIAARRIFMALFVLY
jgi:hypothetical protein